MKDAIGGSLLLYLVVIFTSIIILFFAGILAYSKAYKVKNKIVQIIESYDGQISQNDILNLDVESAIEMELRNTGYRFSSAPSDERCRRDSSRDVCKNLNKGEFNYCICYHGENPSNDGAVNFGASYEVITYVHFAFPVIGDLLTFPVKGETRVLGKDYNY